MYIYIYIYIHIYIYIERERYGVGASSEEATRGRYTSIHLGYIYLPNRLCYIYFPDCVCKYTYLSIYIGSELARRRPLVQGIHLYIWDTYIYLIVYV